MCNYVNGVWMYGKFSRNSQKFVQSPQTCRATGHHHNWKRGESQVICVEKRKNFWVGGGVIDITGITGLLSLFLRTPPCWHWDCAGIVPRCPDPVTPSLELQSPKMASKGRQPTAGVWRYAIITGKINTFFGSPCNLPCISANPTKTATHDHRSRWSTTSLRNQRLCYGKAKCRLVCSAPQNGSGGVAVHGFWKMVVFRQPKLPKILILPINLSTSQQSRQFARSRKSKNRVFWKGIIQLITQAHFRRKILPVLTKNALYLGTKMQIW